MLKVRSSQDLLSGLLFVAFGAAGMWFGREYNFGTAFRMGPGFLPVVLSGLLMLVGLAVIGKGITVAGPRIERIVWRPMLVVLGGVVLFAVLIDRLGLAATTAVVTFLVTYAAPATMPLWRRFVFALVLAAFAVGLFVYGLRQAIPAWWWN